MPRALNLLRPALHYRRDSFDAGLRAAGFDVVPAIDRPQRGDVLAVWNRYGGFDDHAGRFEAAGGTVLVIENGPLGKGWRGGEWFSLAVGHHAGAGRWPDGGASRWNDWRVDLAPYRTGGRETLIFGQRGIGEPGIRSPDRWAESVRGRFGGRIRPHPGTGEPAVSLEADLRDARECITWHSGAALQALLAGVPVWYAFPQWIGAAACWPLAEYGKKEPRRDDEARRRMFERLAWSTWTLDEIRTGLPIRMLLEC